jgi:hypothetical protein
MTQAVTVSARRSAARRRRGQLLTEGSASPDSSTGNAGLRRHYLEEAAHAELG